MIVIQLVKAKVLTRAFFQVVERSRFGPSWPLILNFWRKILTSYQLLRNRFLPLIQVALEEAKSADLISMGRKGGVVKLKVLWEVKILMTKINLNLNLERKGVKSSLAIRKILARSLFWPILVIVEPITLNRAENRKAASVLDSLWMRSVAHMRLPKEGVRVPRRGNQSPEMAKMVQIIG